MKAAGRATEVAVLQWNWCAICVLGNEYPYNAIDDIGDRS
jgi:hypothetical protein